ncbi:MAG: hypothetical protein CMN30_02775 [Sandaracinus sp.]|nr:hypothetical protein [Sandaracinus sp.]
MNGRRWRVYYLALGAVLLFGVALPKALGPYDGLVDPFGTTLGADFVAFYIGGQLMLERRGSELYDFDAQLEVERALSPQQTKGQSLFINPPPYAVFMAPFAALPYPWALAAWWALALLLFFGSHRAVHRALGTPRGTRDALASLLFLPALLVLVMGQNTFLSLALTTSAFLALRARREGLAGVVLGLMIMKPQLALGFAVVLLVQRRWRAVVGAIAVASAFCGLAEVLAPGAWASYLGSLAETSEMVRNAHGGVLFPAFLQVSVPGALALLFVPQPLALAAGLGLLGVVAWRWRKPAWEPGTAPWDRELASAMTLGWLASPHLLLYDLGLLLLPGWIARARLGEHEGRPFGGRRFYALTLLALVAAALWIPLFSVWLWDTLGELDRPRVIPQLVTVVLVAWALALGRRAAIH